MSLAQMQRPERKTAADVSPSAVAIKVAAAGGDLYKWRHTGPLQAAFVTVFVLVVLLILAGYLFLGLLPEDTFWLLVILACSPFSHGSIFFQV